MLLPPALGSSPHPPVSVCGTGAYHAIAAFLDSWARTLRYSVFAPRHGLGPIGGFSSLSLVPLAPVYPLPGRAPLLCPHSSDDTQCRNVHLLSIGYVLRPRLRSRLTQGRSALPWKPWIFGRKDSHLPLATHSGILSSILSTAPFGTASSCIQCSSTNHF